MECCATTCCTEETEGPRIEQYKTCCNSAQFIMEDQKFESVNPPKTSESGKVMMTKASVALNSESQAQPLRVSILKPPLPTYLKVQNLRI